MARPKKEKPIPVLCTCGRQPVVAKARGRGWIVACPAVRGCFNNRTSGFWPTEAEAVENWNLAIRERMEEIAKKGGRKNGDTSGKRH